jgi:hypothetical protein
MQETRESHILAMGKEITALWKRLDTPEAEQVRTFLQYIKPVLSCHAYG